MTTEQREREFDEKIHAMNTAGNVPSPTERIIRARYLVSQVLGAQPKPTASVSQLRWMYAHRQPIATAMVPVDLPPEPVGGSFTPTPPSGTPAVPEKRKPLGRPTGAIVLKKPAKKPAKPAKKPAKR